MIEMLFRLGAALLLSLGLALLLAWGWNSSEPANRTPSQPTELASLPPSPR